MKILDLDLDFFLHDAAYWRESGDERLDAEEFPPWSVDDALAFLEGQCGLGGKLPGFAVEYHSHVFLRWRDAIAVGALTPPFVVTHVDAHADLGLGDAGYLFLLTELLFASPDFRPRHPKLDNELTDGNWLSFAVACRWVSGVTYVHNTDEERPRDMMAPVMENFDPHANNIQLAAIPGKAEVMRAMSEQTQPEAVFLEEKIPLDCVPWKSFAAPDRFDVICLARSPGFTPPEADDIFDMIRSRYIDEALLAP